MAPPSSTAIHPRGSPRPGPEWWDLARTIAAKVAFVALIPVIALQLGGCRAVEAIFKVGVWLGVMIVVTIVAVIGGVAALVMRRS